MQFDYRKEPNRSVASKLWIKRPKIQVTIFYGSKQETVISLVDSGADDCMFHSSFGDLLGIDVPSGIPKTYGGIAEGHAVKGYLHPIQLQVLGFSERIEVMAAFTDSVGVDGLLGQSGFFESYQVIFEGYRGKLEIKPRP